MGPPGRLFHEQLDPGFASHGCFTSEKPHVLLIHRAAFYVAMFDDNGLRTPYLMMHKGLDMPTDTLLQGDGIIDDKDGVPVAEGIEQLQVAYILDTHRNDTDGTPLILGVNEPMGLERYGEDWEKIDKQNALPPGWFFNITYGDPSPPFSPEQMSDKRLLDHPANIRQVRLTLISRSTVADQELPVNGGDDLLLRPDGTPYPDGETLPNAGVLPWRHLENLPLEPMEADFKPQGGRHYRIILREAVTPKNMLLNRQFPPMTEGGG
jgi:type IV pilus assembly protein PilW